MTITVNGLTYQPDEALALWKELKGLLKEADWPRLELVTVDPDDEGELPQLRCPRCGGLDDAVTCEDRSGPRWTRLEAEYDRNLVSSGGDYGSAPDCHTFLFLCTTCEKPVRLPEGWTEL